LISTSCIWLVRIHVIVVLYTVIFLIYVPGQISLLHGQFDSLYEQLKTSRPPWIQYETENSNTYVHRFWFMQGTHQQNTSVLSKSHFSAVGIPTPVVPLMPTDTCHEVCLSAANELGLHVTPLISMFSCRHASAIELRGPWITPNLTTAAYIRTDLFRICTFASSKETYYCNFR